MKLPVRDKEEMTSIGCWSVVTSEPSFIVGAESIAVSEWVAVVGALGVEETVISQRSRDVVVL